MGAPIRPASVSPGHNKPPSVQSSVYKRLASSVYVQVMQWYMSVQATKPPVLYPDQLYYLNQLYWPVYVCVCKPWWTAITPHNEAEER